MEDFVMYAVLGAGLLALVYAVVQAKWVSAQDAGTDRMKELSGYIRDGAMAFLKKEYRVLSVFVLVVAVALFGMYYYTVSSGKLESGTLSAVDMGLVSVSFLVGAICSALAGFFGMRVATDANVRTTQAARTGIGGALKIYS